MRFIGMLLIWIGGGLWLYVDLQEPVQIVMEYWKTKAQPADYTVFNWIKLFAQPLFVFGVMCAVAMPKLNGKKKKKAKKPAQGGQVISANLDSAQKTGDPKTDKPSS